VDPVEQVGDSRISELAQAMGDVRVQQRAHPRPVRSDDRVMAGADGVRHPYQAGRQVGPHRCQPSRLTEDVAEAAAQPVQVRPSNPDQFPGQVG
jgi:hypothetical protein